MKEIGKKIMDPSTSANSGKSETQSTEQENVIKVRLDGGLIPKKATLYSAGYDVSCPKHFEIEPGDQIMIGTGIYMELPRMSYAELRTRSSMAKDMVRVEGGIIDSDYRGEVKVLLHNYGKKKYKSNNLRIAQMIVHPYGEYKIIEGSLSESNIHLGFGSTN